jgi:hypothetical protein
MKLQLHKCQNSHTFVDTPPVCVMNMSYGSGSGSVMLRMRNSKFAVSNKESQNNPIVNVVIN